MFLLMICKSHIANPADAGVTFLHSTLTFRCKDFLRGGEDGKGACCKKDEQIFGGILSSLYPTQSSSAANEMSLNVFYEILYICEHQTTGLLYGGRVMRIDSPIHRPSR